MKLEKMPAFISYKDSSGYAFGKRIMNLRKLRGRSQQWLCEVARVSVPTICNVESGRGNPSLETIFSVATALEVHPAYLFLPDVDVWPDRELLFSNVMAGISALAGVEDARVEYEDELIAIRDAFKSIIEKEAKRSYNPNFLKDL